jgi:hypothetical protein
MGKKYSTIQKIRNYYLLSFFRTKKGVITSKPLWEFFFIQAQITKEAIAPLKFNGVNFITSEKNIQHSFTQFLNKIDF